MEANIEKDCSAIEVLFQTIISDMRSSCPVWEDFSVKATKLHTTLKTTLFAIGAFLDAFQKVADIATGSRGATKDIGSALTRLCMRHRSIENKLKSFTSAILDHLVTPIQERIEEWKKTVAQLDKEHAKDYKKARLEIKKAAQDTIKLQKKVKKGKTDMQARLDCAMQDVSDKYYQLEETEKNVVRMALIEERGRFCHFITCLKPFVDEEVSLLSEVHHLEEIMDNLCKQVGDPQTLPSSSEQVILDIKGLDTSVWNFQTPPSSPSSLGSRKSSMCSISSMASSSSGSTQSHSPSHNKTIIQNSDNASTGTDTPDLDSTPTTPSDHLPGGTPSASSTWTNWPNQPANNGKTEGNRPHTISSAYEKTHYSRPTLNSQTFEPPPKETLEKSSSEEIYERSQIQRQRPQSTMGSVMYSRPSAAINKMQPILPPLGPKPKPKVVPPPKVPPIAEQPQYANLEDIARLIAERKKESIELEQDLEKTPTAKHPPVTDISQSFEDAIDLTQAIRDLDNYTAALHGDFEHGTVADRNSKIRQNSMELAAAIRELEASTAALQSTYDTDSQNSCFSLQCSSGYGTMNSTPASSEDTIASGDYDMTHTASYVREQEKYNTIPRNSQISQMYRTAFQAKRPASTAGVPASQGVGSLTRRASINAPKPPPPVRRSSSITTASPAVLHKLRASPPKQLNPQNLQSMHQQGHGHMPNSQGHMVDSHGHHPQHRESSSISGQPEHSYADLSEIQQCIQMRKHQQQLQQRQSQSENQSQSNGRGVSSEKTNVNMSVSASISPPYATPSVQGERVQSQGEDFPPPPPLHSGDDDLPPPPSEEELHAIYYTPNISNPVTQSQSMPRENNLGGQPDFRQSLISEMKKGSKFKQFSLEADDTSQC
ncbi:hypothetical protein CHS0354_042942 [Potamilus streckersoni]|uniref:IMD domain-containing protein n=1 Tax=Potamilus streckersoni TaxID=2493646 RepID=A0AAE0W736_9BIVA|nr:hypothetical protein CHS0354_042942 [Potamilus streckersoni]